MRDTLPEVVGAFADAAIRLLTPAANGEAPTMSNGKIPDPNVRVDAGGWISGACLPLSPFKVMIYDGNGTTSSYVVAAEDEVSAAAKAGAQHGGPVDSVEVEPWAQP